MGSVSAKVSEVRPPRDSRDSSAPLASGLPAVRHVERQRPARLEVRLVEAGKRLVRPRRHEDRVEKVVVAVERRVARLEVERQDVSALVQGAGRHDEVLVDFLDRDQAAVGSGRVKGARAVWVEVERQRRGCVGEREASRARPVIDWWRSAGTTNDSAYRRSEMRAARSRASLSLTPGSGASGTAERWPATDGPTTATARSVTARPQPSINQ